MRGEELIPAAGLLDLAVSRPLEALAAARELLAARPVALEASYAHQAMGLVLRDMGELVGARRELNAARRAAAVAGEPLREADVLASLAVALVMSGRTAACLAAFGDAVALAKGATGPVLGRVLVRRGAVLGLLGRHAAAVVDLRAGAVASRSAGEPAWEGRALLSLTMSLLATGDVSAAEVAAADAERLLRLTGQDLEAAKAVHNRGLVAFQAGRLPAALGHLARAEERYDALAYPVPELAGERCAVLLVAGLPQDALVELDEAIARAPAPTVRATLLLAAGSAALAAGDLSGARQRSREAERLFRRQSRDGWAARARFLRLAADPAAPVRRVAAVAAELTALGAVEAPLAHLLAGRRALQSGSDARPHLLSAAKGRRRGPALGRASGELAVALLARSEGRSRDLLRACTRGLDALDEHRLSLGAPDLRALAGAHGAELTELALAETLTRGHARALLRVTERGRAAALAVPAVAPAEDAGLARELAALRDVTRRLADGPSPTLDRERAQHERAVRRLRHEAAASGTAAGRLDLDALFAALGDTTLVELVGIRGELHALVVSRRRVRRVPVGPATAAFSELAHSHAALRRAAHGRPPDLAKVGARLQAAVLGATRLPDASVVVVPPNRLHDAPWGILPALADVPVSVAPSAAIWLRARGREAPAGRPVVLVAGPGLGTGGAEIAPLAALHPGALVLEGPAATADAVLAALDGAGLVHVASHGDFRADSPMFSSLRMADGPLTVHDLERLRSAPHRLVLSACESGVAASVGGDDLLGLSTALLGLGTAGVLASCVPVNDEASVPVAVAVHQALAAGADLATALLAARQAAQDPVVAATAAAGLAMGV